MRAVEVLRAVNRTGATTLPDSAPTAFVRPRWARYVLPGGAIDRRHYELCVLSELRDRLRAGDVWVTGSRQYRSFEDRLVSPSTLAEMRRDGTVPVAVEADFDRFIAAHRAVLDERLAATDAKAKGGLLPDVTLDKGVLRITPVARSTPPEAEALAARLYGLLPRVRITDLLAEVDGWTRFTDAFTHLRTGQPAEDQRVILTAVLADATNLGLTRMAVSKAAMREGVLFDMLGRGGDDDPREFSIRNIMQRYGIDTAQATRVEQTAVRLFDQVARPWQLDGDDLRKLVWAARVHELGLVIAHSQYHVHGAYVLEHSDIAGFSRQEQQFLAALVRCHRRKVPKSAFDAVPDRLLVQARRTAALLRLAVLLHRSHEADDIPLLQAGVADDVLTLHFSQRWLDARPLLRIDLEGEPDEIAPLGIRLVLSAE